MEAEAEEKVCREREAHFFSEAWASPPSFGPASPGRLASPQRARTCDTSPLPVISSCIVICVGTLVLLV